MENLAYPLVPENDTANQPEHPREAQTSPDQKSGPFFAHEELGGSDHRRSLGRCAINLLKSAGMTARTIRHNHYVPRQERSEEIEDRRIYRGEATGFERSVRLLGREYASNGPPVVVTKPLGVKFPGYIAEHLTTVCPEIERPMLVVGSVGFSRDRKYDSDDREKFHMSWMAADVHSIIDQVEAGETGTEGRCDWPELSFERFDCSGASQGAMVGLELAAQARYFGRQVDKAALVAPAGLAEAYGHRPQQLLNFMKFARQFGWREFLGVCSHLAHADETERQRIINQHLPTIPPPRSATVPVITTAIEILKGPMRGIGRALEDAGVETEFDILLYDDDTVSTPELWEGELSNLPSAKIIRRPGRHITGIISQETDQFVAENLKSR